MAERITLTTPYRPDPREATDLRVGKVNLDWINSIVHIVLFDRDETGNIAEMGVQYIGNEAADLMRTLNKANLSTKSLHRRIIEKLIADGKIAGTLSGTVD